MNNSDRSDIASVLNGVSSDDRNSIVNAGKRLLLNHQKITEFMDETSLEWWEIERDVIL